MKRLLYFLMAMLGFGLSSCSMRCEYGTPHIEFRLTARVVDEDGEPIQGIRVRAYKGTTLEGVIMGEEFPYNTGYSDYRGEIDAYGTMWPGSQERIIFDDIDGELNGGEFELLLLDIADRVDQTESGDGNWNSGSFEAELGDVVLRRKVVNDEEEGL